MGDSPRHSPRSAYAQPGGIDTSLVEAESLRLPLLRSRTWRVRLPPCSRVFPNWGLPPL